MLWDEANGHPSNLSTRAQVELSDDEWGAWVKKVNSIL